MRKVFLKRNTFFAYYVTLMTMINQRILKSKQNYMNARYLVSIILLVVNTLSGHGQFRSEKRGLAYGYHSPNDLNVLADGVSWWYNWAVTPETTVANIYEDYGFDFVPMAWNHLFDEVKLRTYLDDHPDVKYILGFNEPNDMSQSAMTPSEAAASWHLIESIADDYNLKIVGPAVNYCGTCVSEGGITYTSPFDYLDDFLTACADCRIDYIGVHSYMNTVGALEWYIGEFKKYGKPIWLTEFAGWEPNGNINSVNDQISYLIGAVDFLEYDPDIFRYSWFIGRGNGASTYPYIDVLAGDGELTELGEVYVNMPVHDTNIYYSLPGRIEAESYTHMDGILLEKTSDVSGFANVGYIDPGDWLEYNVNVESEDEYFMVFRIASTSSSSLKLSMDGIDELNQSFSNTRGWQNWQSFYSAVHFTEGEHKLRLTAQTAGFNINWIELTTEKPDIIENLGINGDINIYPNPGSGILFISPNSLINDIEILDTKGNIILTRVFTPEVDISELPAGVYFIRLLNRDLIPVKTAKILVR
jgi:hypothetical protein